MPRPTGPAASNHRLSTASSPNTTSPIPSASRAQGARCWRTDVRAGAARLPDARPFVFLANYTSTITGRMTGLRCVTS